MRFSASDGNRKSDETVLLRVADVNQYAEHRATRYLVNENQTLQFTLAGGDPDGDPLTYFVSGNLPSGASFVPTTQTFAWTPSHDQAGTYNVTFGVA